MRRRLLALVPVVVVAAIVGVAAGTIAARTRSTAASVAVEASSGPVGPSAPPAIPEGFPNASQVYLPATVTELRDAWLEQEPDWDCERTASSFGTSVTCRPPASALDLGEQYGIELRIVNRDTDPEPVTGVDAGCELDGPGSRRCRSFFADVAGIVLGGDPALSEEARKWARENTAEDTTTVIGGVRLTAELEPQQLTFEPELTPR